MSSDKALRKEINEILLKPMPWGPMIVPRVKTVLVQASELIAALVKVNKQLDMKIKFYEGTRSDTKLSRNLAMMNLYENGKSLSFIANEFGLTRQRVHKIIQVTRKYLESQYDPSRIEGLPRERDSISEGAISAGQKEDHPSSPNRRW